MSKFKEFKDNFYSKFKDLNQFNINDFNLTKVIIDGLFIKYNYKTISHFTFYPSALFWIYIYSKRIRHVIKHNFKLPWRQVSGVKKKKILLIDPGRFIYDKNNNLRSVYFNNLIRYFDKKDYNWITEASPKENSNDYDIYIDKIINQEIFKISPEIKKIRKQIRVTYNNIITNNKLTIDEKGYIKSALDIFFRKALFYDYLFKKLKPEKILFICHYHKEGLILAARLNKIKIVELQHGLIAKSDIFYNFPKQIQSVKKDMLFADEIWLYGEYWKSKLGYEYPDKKIKIIGYYPFSPLTSNTKYIFRNDMIYILLATQPRLQTFYIDYIEQLAKELSKTNKYQIIIKPHPSESPSAYIDIQKKYNNVTILNENIHYLLHKCHFILSVYSTTLFEAFLYMSKPIAIYYELYSDYIEELQSINIPIIYDIYDFTNNIETHIKMRYTNTSSILSKFNHKLL